MLIDIATSTLSSTARGWRGTSAMVRTAQPEHWLVLYDMEGCPYCRTVREVLTELDLNVFIKPCPKGQPGFREELAQLSGVVQSVVWTAADYRDDPPGNLRRAPGANHAGLHVG